MTRRFWLIRGTAIAIGIAGCLATAGCTPPSLGQVGVILDGGRPAILIHPCPGIAVNQVWVYEADLRWGIADSGDHPVTEIQLLQVPDGWHEPAVPVENQLTEFRSDGTYQVQLTTDHPERGGVPIVQFTVDDLTADRVWATRTYGEPQIMTRDEFVTKTAEAC